MGSLAIIGAGPAGLMAAEAAAEKGVRVSVYDAMPSVGRKFLMAGKGGLNLTHSEALEVFLSRYGVRRPDLEPLLQSFGPDQLRAWALGLGVETFVGSSGRVFPRDFKAAPLLRAWLHRLRGLGVRFHVRYRWLGWNDDGALRFLTPRGEVPLRVDAIVLALGGGSWPQLGSDAAWVPWLQAKGIDIRPLRPSNCGFEVAWSEHFKARFAGQPVKSVVGCFRASGGELWRQQGELTVTEKGLEGGLIYTLSGVLRDEIEARGSAILSLDLAPQRTLRRLTQDLAGPRGKFSWTNFLRRRTGLDAVKLGLLREVASAEALANAAQTAETIKALPVPLVKSCSLENAISSAGGVAFESLDERLMLCRLPGIFCAGEMLDWEAPTGGYLLTACFASGKAAGMRAAEWLESCLPIRNHPG